MFFPLSDDDLLVNGKTNTQAQPHIYTHTHT